MFDLAVNLSPWNRWMATGGTVLLEPSLRAVCLGEEGLAEHAAVVAGAGSTG
jgi:hypothetical protein